MLTRRDVKVFRLRLILSDRDSSARDEQLRREKAILRMYLLINLAGLSAIDRTSNNLKKS